MLGVIQLEFPFWQDVLAVTGHIHYHLTFVLFLLRIEILDPSDVTERVAEERNPFLQYPYSPLTIQTESVAERAVSFRAPIVSA